MSAQPAVDASPLFPHLELHRRGIGQIPLPGGGDEASAIHVESPDGKARPLRSCTCDGGDERTCRHLKMLSKGVADLRRHFGPTGWWDLFTESIWSRLARKIFDARACAVDEIRLSEVGGDGETVLLISTERHGEIARYQAGGALRTRLLERLGRAPREAGYADRATLLERLAMFQLSTTERRMNEAGFKTSLQAWEESFWHRLAYHVVREHGPRGGIFHPAIDRSSGAFTLTFHDGDRPICRIRVPRRRVQEVLRLLAAAYPEQEDFAIQPVPLQAFFHLTADTELDLEVRPMIRALQADGKERFLAGEEVEKFRYGRLVYLPQMGVMAELERPDRERKFRTPKAMKLRRSQVPAFLDEHRDAVARGELVLEPAMRDLRVFREPERVEIEAVEGGVGGDGSDGGGGNAVGDEALHRDWHWLSLRYGFGNQTISLAEILRARRRGMPYLETSQGWVDLEAPAIRALDELLPRRLRKEHAAAENDAAISEHLHLHPGEVLRLRAASGQPLRIDGETERAERLRRVLELRPSAPYAAPVGLASALHPYQERGVEWLRFLWDHHLGGLLCDDMGLGKTHQAMALMLVLREQGESDQPYLVVAPTTVLGHWQDKLRVHAPGLRAAVHHGPERDLDALGEVDVLITSYGVLRRDAEAFGARRFAVAFFDEIQHLKNRRTVSYRAASEINARLLLGLTGTPIENSLGELHALFDQVLPGHLGSEDAFRERYLQADEKDEDKRLDELQRLTAPFMLRRLKASVLEDLPEKIEDPRHCALSDDQVALYREVIEGRGARLAERVATEDTPPYLHVFAVLNHLKQICDHPALALRDLDRADTYASGKWDLYLELLQGCLDSGLKVVVFSQYLGMIELMRRHLVAAEVGHAVLTGASVRRGEIVRRFNEDADCRVFLGSLKAGGTGIDLVGGSVVIHYDRWWNAAREDQATDRVHRMGQRRAVQVFTLVTEGTLEEKISGIIDHKRRLMNRVVTEDDAQLAKVFTREELLELLRPI